MDQYQNPRANYVQWGIMEKNLVKMPVIHVNLEHISHQLDK